MNRVKNYKSYKAGKIVKSKKKLNSNFVLAIIILFLSFGAYFWGSRVYYDNNLKAVDINSREEVEVTIVRDSSLKQISRLLKTKQLIRSTRVFERYVISKQLTNNLQAGTYRFTKSQNVSSIVNDLVNYKIAKNLFTILPQQRLEQVRDAMIEAGFPAAQVDDALNAQNYQGNPALADKPPSANLEGYLYPESYEKTDATTPQKIIESALDEMKKALDEVFTADVRANLAKQNINVHQAITLASIVEKEVASQEDRDKAAQVFLKRYSIGMRLESDVTAIYGAIIAGQDQHGIGFDSPYNTYMHDGLPIGPIGNVTRSGLRAVAHPANTDFLYFVAGDDQAPGEEQVTYFSRTKAEHDQAVKDHCKTTCAQ